MMAMFSLARNEERGQGIQIHGGLMRDDVQSSPHNSHLSFLKSQCIIIIIGTSQHERDDCMERCVCVCRALMSCWAVCKPCSWISISRTQAGQEIVRSGRRLRKSFQSGVLSHTMSRLPLLCPSACPPGQQQTAFPNLTSPSKK